MTKRRPALTVEDAANRVIGALTMEEAIKATGRSSDYLRSLTDPDKRYKLTVEDALKLDLAHQAAGLGGMPIYETYGLLADVANAERFSDKHRFAQLVAKFVKEVGEAGGALVLAQLPGSGPQEDEEARRQTTDVVDAATRLLAYLSRDGGAAEAPP